MIQYISCTIFNGSDSINGIGYELMAFAHFSLGSVFFIRTGAGFNLEPHHISSQLAQDKMESVGNIELDFGAAF